jgi:Tfp pilus assembly protein PilV
MDMYFHDGRKNVGFTLIEVLISLIIVVVGVVAVLQLQGVFFNTVSDAEKRAVAYRLAETKLEELRGYDSRTIFYTDIVDSSEAVMPIPNVEYTIDVNVENYIASGGSLTLTASASLTEVKEVDVTVSWNSGSVALSSVALSSMIANIEPNVSPLLGLGNIGGETPDVDYSAGQAPDVIAIKVGDDKLKETSKPLPEIKSKNRSTVVQFETVTYRDSTTKQLVKDDFLTVNCTCTFNGTATITTPYHYDLSVFNDKYTLNLVAGKQVSAPTGVPKTGVNQSDQFCTRCCAGHHDATDPSVYAAESIPSFNGTGNHDHYNFSATGTKPDVTLSGPVASGDYLEACRFVRVDGIYRLVPDWNMIALNAMPRSILVSSASSSLSTYQDYVVAKVQAEAFGLMGAASGSDVSIAASQGASSEQSLAASLAAASAYTTISGEQTQFLSRAIYLDDMTYDQDWVDLMTSAAASSAWLSSGTWLEFVPFNELNTTLLTTWKSASDSVATVTSDDVNETIEDGTDFYIVFSRGVVEGGSTAGSTAIMAVSKTDNTGVLGNTYADVPQVPAGTDHAGFDNRITDGVSEMTASVEVTNNLCTSECIVAGIIPIKITGNTDTADLLALDLDVSATNDISCTLDDLTDDTIATLVLETGQMRYRCSVTASGGVASGNVTLLSEASTLQTKSYNIAGGVGGHVDFDLVTP